MEAQEKIKEILEFIEQRQEKTCKFIEYVRIVDKQEWDRQDGKEIHQKQREVFLNFGTCKISISECEALNDGAAVRLLHFILFEVLENPISEAELEELAARVVACLFISMDGKSHFMAGDIKVEAQQTGDLSKAFRFQSVRSTNGIVLYFNMGSVTDELAVRLAAFILGVECSQPESDYDKRLKFWG